MRRLWSRLTSGWVAPQSADPEPLTRLDQLGGLRERRFPAAVPHNSPTPIFDETVLATGVLPWAAGSVEVDGGAS